MSRTNASANQCLGGQGASGFGVRQRDGADVRGGARRARQFCHTWDVKREMWGSWQGTAILS